MYCFRHLHALISLLPVLLTANARKVNVTVDDAGFDPLTGNAFAYSPSPSWNLGSACEDCASKPDPVQTYNGTWHDATYHEEDGNYCGINLEFTGKHHTFMYEVND